MKIFKSRNRKLAEEVEKRTLIHLKKLNKIEEILTIEKSKRTPAIIIIDKIEGVIEE